MAPTSHTPLSESVSNVDSKDIGESFAKTSLPNQNPPLVNALSVKDTTKQAVANSGKN